MSFVYWCYQAASGQLGVLNPLAKTGGCLSQWNLCKATHSKEPEVGSIAIMDFGNGNGHTFIVTNIVAGIMETIEGNTNDNGSSNGIGVFQLERRIANPKIKGYLVV